MIFFAVAGPTPGKLSNSFSLAVFKSTLALVVAAFAELAVDSFGGLDFLLVWPAKMLEVITPHANTVANNRRKPTAPDILIQFSFCVALFESIRVRIVRPNPKQNFSIFLPKRPRGRDIVEIQGQQLILSLLPFRSPFHPANRQPIRATLVSRECMTM
jgi:hypothetical protein